MARILPALLLAGTAIAKSWTATQYYVISETTSVWTEYSETYTYTDTLYIDKSFTPTATEEAVSSETYTYDYESLELVYVYYPADAIPTSAIDTDDGYDYNALHTVYAQDVTYTAPSSCETPFTITTHTVINIPTEAADQVSLETVITSRWTGYGGDVYTDITAMVDPSQVPVSINSAEDFIVSYYLNDCYNPNPTYDDYDDYDDNDEDSDNSDSWTYSYNSWYWDTIHVYIIVLAVTLPALFLLGFLESYFWFRRLMRGQYSIRFGTVCWLLLFLPVLCFMRSTPSRDDDTQKRLKEQWKAVPMGKAIKLWFKWGFRHRYPIEMLGIHPTYNNPRVQFVNAPVPVGQAPGGGAPPQGGYVYYMPGVAPPQPGQVQPGQEHAGHWDPKGKDPEMMQQQPQGGMPPQGMVMYYPQYPQQVYVQPQAPMGDASQQQQHQQQQAPTIPSPVSGDAVVSAPPPAVSPQPPVEVAGQQDQAGLSQAQNGESSRSGENRGQ